MHTFGALEPYLNGLIINMHKSSNIIFHYENITVSLNRILLLGNKSWQKRTNSIHNKSSIALIWCIKTFTCILNSITHC
jgi:hypothetical protein